MKVAEDIFIQNVHDLVRLQLILSLSSWLKGIRGTSYNVIIDKPITIFWSFHSDTTPDRVALHCMKRVLEF